MTMDADQISKLMTNLETLGEEEVRRWLSMGQWGDSGSDMRTRVEDWLRAKGAKRETDIALAAREAVAVAQEANAIALSAEATAKDALRTARQERTATYIAAIAAIIAVLVAIIK